MKSAGRRSVSRLLIWLISEGVPDMRAPLVVRPAPPVDAVLLAVPVHVHVVWRDGDQLWCGNGRRHQEKLPRVNWWAMRAHVSWLKQASLAQPERLAT